MANNAPNPPTKRAAPITASAFSFSLNTPKAKKARPITAATPLSSSSTFQLARQTPTRVKAEPSTPALYPNSKESRPREPATPLRTHEPPPVDEDVKPMLLPLSHATPRRLVSVFQPLNALHTPSNKAAKLGDPGPSTSKALRRINDRIGLITPRREVETDIDEKPKIALNDARPSAETVTEDLFAKKKASLMEEDEGVGVSPRGKRIQKWSGKGATPPSVHLANLLSSSNSSLHLFYTSTQHLLYPSHRSNLTPARSNQPKPTANVTPFAHIQSSAVIRLRLTTSVPGPTHHSTMFWCEVLKWSSSSSTGSFPTRILAILQPIPSECPRLGLDSRLLASKGPDNQLEKKWQVGVWSWSEVEIPQVVIGDGIADEGDEDGEEDGVKEYTKALLVTRYLIAEEPASATVA
ncbi:hypothetical protein CI109_101266 [Kwoniella shandongensis]|uniref:Uncharacterized protein n=1 Tax=Kwoniella shandongensis TaxID=1734106 RepID=A0A5M6BR74_9TREE|nr:uncharacterized protein CI109_007232 [Kwoniella shandongensis]KAA5524440.1 hypothetical protein CI109_007232 [Kwoniella shandongensis]